MRRSVMREEICCSRETLPLDIASSAWVGSPILRSGTALVAELFCYHYPAPGQLLDGLDPNWFRIDEYAGNREEPIEIGTAALPGMCTF